MSDLSQRLAALSPEKRALLELQLKKKGSTYNTFPLSYAQQRLWLLDQLQPGNTSYNMPFAFTIRGMLDVAMLEKSLTTILARHEALRTSFTVVRGKPVQVIALAIPIILTPIDMSNMSSTVESEQAIQGLLDAEGQHVFDLTRGPLVRFTLIRVASTRHTLIVNMHHICSDGWSLAVFTRELSALYAAYVDDLPMPLPPLPLQYADYAVWQHSQREEQERQISYWRERLRDAPPLLELPTDYARPATQAYRGDHASRELPTDLVARLRALGQRENATLFMTMMAVFQIVLSRLTGQVDIVVGTPIANRNRAELENLIGFFVNMLALRVDLNGNPTFSEIVRRTREVALGAYTFQDVSFDRLLEELNPPRDLSHAPIFQVVFNMTNIPQMETQWGDLAVTISIPQEIGAKFDLTLYVEETDDGVTLEAVYNADLFTSARMHELLAQYAFVAEQISVAPDQHLSQISLVTPSAQAVLPDPTAPLSAQWQGAVHELFAQHAARQPTKIAVMDDSDAWSYHELEARSNQLAHYLSAQGIAPGGVVAIYANRNASLVWAILGIFKAGATYTILDPAYPLARLIDYVQQAQPQGLIVIADTDAVPTALIDNCAPNADLCILRLPRLSQVHATEMLTQFPTTAPAVTVGPDDIASITFTSGSTGRPKGILQRHGPLTHFLPWQQATFGLSEHDRFTMLSGLSHDPLQRDIFTPLCLGATVCIPAASAIGTPGQLGQWLRDTAITVTNVTPAMAQLLTQPLPGGAPVSVPTLRLAFTVGDALKRHDVVRLGAMAPQVTCVNMYGSTETQRAVSYYRIPNDSAETMQQPTLKEVIPLGRGWHDVQVLVMTPAQTLAGVGEPGELNMRSPHLAQGYLGDPALTAERFVSNPFTRLPTDRLYRTGDLGRYLPDGNVEYLARVDQQVKIRGFRIELGEIEAVLRQHPTVRDVAVIAREDSTHERHIVAYIIPTSTTAPDDIATLRQAVQVQLPGYMMPAAFVVLESLPLTPNGKLDRAALQKMDFAITPREGIVAPRTPLETTLAQNWQEVLHLEQISVFANFFELGGHSLLATQLIARIIETTQFEVTLRMFFEAPTIAALAHLIEARGLPATTAQPPNRMPIARLSRVQSPDHDFPK